MAMEDLAVAAREAVTKVQPLLQDLAEAERESHAAVGYVEAMRAKLDEDEKALQETVAALSRDADEVQLQLSDEAAAATAALGVVATALRQAATDAAADLDAEGEAMEHAATLLTELGPDLAEVAAAAEAASSSALELAAAVAQGLDDAVEKLDHLLSVDLPFFVAEIRQQIEAVTGEVITFLSEKCPQFLDGKQHEWDEKLAAVTQLMETSIEHVEQHTRDVADHTQERWKRLVDDEMTEIEAEAHTLVDELGALTRTASDKDGQLKVAGEMVEERQDGGSQAAAAVEHELANVRGRWATFGITC